jgi:hypothetical protein
MRGLLRLYPPEWRARYGEEFEALLEEQQTSLGMVLDVLLGALDAHLERGRGGSTMATRMRTLPALAISLGSLLWVISGLGFPARLLPAGAWISITASAGMVVIAVGVVSLGLLHERGRSLTLPLAVLAAAGLLADAAINTAFLVGALPWIGDVQTWPEPVGLAALGAQAAFALAVLRAQVLPRLPLIGIAAFSLTVIFTALVGPASVIYWAGGLLSVAWLTLGLAVLVTPTEGIVAEH